MTKPGIIYGNLLMAGSGFLVAAVHFRNASAAAFVSLLAGMALVMASACVFNNLLDTNIDAKMARTKKRALVTHQISRQSAFIYASALGGIGFTILALFTNQRVVWLNLAAIFSYVVIYGWAKRNSVHGTLIGSIPGAIPPAAGYAAVTSLDREALLLFLILVFWQMAHFYAIAMFRYRDYKSAGLPVMPVHHGMRSTRVQILLYIAALAGALTASTVFGYQGYIFLTASLALCLYWLWRGFSNYGLPNEKWGKSMFLFSLLVLMALSVILPIGALLA